MKKIAVIALALSLASTASTAAFAQGDGANPPPPGAVGAVAPGLAPGIVIAGGIGTAGIVLGILGLLILTGLGGSSSTTTTN